MSAILIPIIALLIAVLAVAALWLWWSGGQEDDALVVEVPPPFQETVKLATSSSPVQGEDEMFRITRDPAGKFMIVMDGRTYRSFNEMSITAQEQFQNAVNDLQGVAGLPIQSSAPVVTPPAAPTYSPIKSTPAAKAKEGKAGKSDGKKKEAPPPLPTMAEEIEVLLQGRLAQMPEMATRTIHIHETEDGSILIEADEQFFHGVGEVSDQDVQQVIRAAIEDWELNVNLK